MRTIDLPWRLRPGIIAAGLLFAAAGPAFPQAIPPRPAVEPPAAPVPVEPAPVPAPPAVVPPSVAAPPGVAVPPRAIAPPPIAVSPRAAAPPAVIAPAPVAVPPRAAAPPVAFAPDPVAALPPAATPLPAAAAPFAPTSDPASLGTTYGIYGAPQPNSFRPDDVQRLLREATLRVFLRHYEATLNDVAELEKSIALRDDSAVDAGQKSSQDVRLNTLRNWLAIVQARIQAASELPPAVAPEDPVAPGKPTPEPIPGPRR